MGAFILPLGFRELVSYDPHVVEYRSPFLLKMLLVYQLFVNLSMFNLEFYWFRMLSHLLFVIS